MRAASRARSLFSEEIRAISVRPLRNCESWPVPCQCDRRESYAVSLPRMYETLASRFAPIDRALTFAASSSASASKKTHFSALESEHRLCREIGLNDAPPLRRPNGASPRCLTGHESTPSLPPAHRRPRTRATIRREIASSRAQRRWLAPSRMCFEILATRAASSGLARC